MRITKNYPTVLTYGYSNKHKANDIVGNNGSYNVLDTIRAFYGGTIELICNTCNENFNYAKYGNDANQTAINKYGHSYGNFVLINHGKINGHSYKTRYAHLQSIAVSVGQKVIEGQDIGYMGNTGYSEGGHTHFELIVDGVCVDPYDYLFKGKTFGPTSIGYFDGVSETNVSGWAYNGKDDTALDIHVYVYDMNMNYVDGHPFEKAANIYREDIIPAGAGNGHHGFNIPIDFNKILQPGTYKVRCYMICDNNPWLNREKLEDDGIRELVIKEKALVVEEPVVETPAENEPETSPEEPIEDGQVNTPTDSETIENDTNNEEKKHNVIVSFITMIFKIISEILKGGK